MRRQEDLSRPRRGRLSFGVHYDPGVFGEFSEAIARFLGTARYLVFQTAVVIIWVFVNATVGELRFDEYPFVFLTLVLSLQAAYAAPLILLAQNRQGERDRSSGERDRQVSTRTQADTEFLARELAGVKLSLEGVVTTDDLADTTQRLSDVLDRIETRLAALEARQPD